MSRWLLPGLALVAASVFFVAGFIVWRQMSYPGTCPPFTFCATVEAHRSHPLGAELLWGTSAAFALLAIWSTLRVV
jgi:hypothetical protein